MISTALPAGPNLVARILTTSRVDGDFSAKRDLAELTPQRADLAAGDWTWLRQVHGADVVTVERPGQWAGRTADAAVTTTPGCVLAVQTADCAPVVIVGDGAIGIAHAGWRGIVAGVVQNTVDAIRRAGSTGRLQAYLGPCIRAGSYEFGAEQLDAVAAVAGESVRANTVDGRPALDMTAAVRGVLEGLVDDVIDEGLDTADPEFYSHRVRGDVCRQATVVWLEVGP